MTFLTKAVRRYFSKRLKSIGDFRSDPHKVQRDQLDYLLQEAKETWFGHEHGFSAITGDTDFRKKVEIREYEAFHELIVRAKAGEKNVLWPGTVKWFAKSSGTTNEKSKYIPVTKAGLNDSHMRGPRDVIAFFSDLYPQSDIFRGKTLTLGGSHKVEREGETALTGDLSAILLENTPWWANSRKVPRPQTALIADFEEKVLKICEETVKKDVRSFAGVPSWNLVLMNRVLEYTGKNNILDVWPNMELFIHGGVSFKPYIEEYRRIIPSPDMKYMETYNASEGFFAIADDPQRDDMLLMLDYGTYYEFLPMSELGNPSAAVPLEGVRRGVNYALIISNSNGLWRYMIGDTVEFTSIEPYRIRITGRTKHFINVFGEEVMVGNAEDALREACNITGAEVAEFTVGPVYMEEGRKGAHEWVVEFVREPSSREVFAEALDRALQKVNSDYEAKRSKNTTLMPLRLSVVKPGTFMRWMESRGKTGGQNKVPRLFNERTFVEQLLETDR